MKFVLNSQYVKVFFVIASIMLVTIESVMVENVVIENESWSGVELCFTMRVLTDSCKL